MGIQLDKSKVNFFEKMIWRIKYRDLYKNFGSNILAMKVLLHDKEVRDFYNKNKSEINLLLDSSEENFSEYKNEIFEILIYSIQAQKFDIVKNNINNIFILRRGLENDNINKDTSKEDFEKELDENIHVVESSLVLDLENVFKNKDIKILTGNISQSIIAEKLEQIRENKEIKDTWMEHKQKTEEKLKQYILSPEDKKIYMEGVRNGELESSLQAFLQLRNNKSFEDSGSLRVKNIIRKNIGYSEYFLVNSKMSFNYESMSCINNAINKTNMTITDIIAARGAYIDAYIDDKMDENNISEVKKYMQLKYIGIPYEFLPDENKTTNRLTKRAIEIARIIESTDSMEKLNKIRRNLDARKYFVEIPSLEEIVAIGKKEKTEDLFNVKEHQASEKDSVEYQGKKIQVINLKGEDYKGFIHVCINIKADNNTKDKKAAFLNNSNLNLCTSGIEDDHMYLAWTGDNEQFTKFGYGNDVEIFQFASQDVGSSPMRRRKEKEKYYPNVYSSEFQGKQEYWNEPIDNYEDQYNEANIYKKAPDYILCIDKISQKDKEWAAAFDVPIVRMDGKEYFEKFDSKYEKIFKSASFGDVSLESFKKMVIYDRQREFFSGRVNIPIKNSEFEGKNFWKLYNSIEKNDENKEKLADIVEFLDGRNKKWENDLASSLDEAGKKKLEQLISELRESRHQFDGCIK